MRIVILSGKGGTGKSTVTANLAFSLSQLMEVTAVDCDVEEPNLHIFFPDGDVAEEEVQTLIPIIDSALCDLCGECARFCRYGALVMGLNGPNLNPQMCHSCGGCQLVCPRDAITERGRGIGKVSISYPKPRLTLITGTLREGEVMAPPVIKKAKDMSNPERLTLLDSSPGIACPVIETLQDADAAILVTESTPLGLHDLGLAAEVTRDMGIPSGVVINRSDGRDRQMTEFCKERSLPILMTIPFDRKIAQVQNRGDLISEIDSTWLEKFQNLYHRTLALKETVQ